MGKMHLMPPTDGGAARKLAPPCPPISLPKLNEFDVLATFDLYHLCKKLEDQAAELTSFVDANRESARRLGIETTIIEIMSILEGETFRQLRDAVQDAASRASSVGLSEDGISKLKRLEKLVGQTIGTVKETAVQKDTAALLSVALGQAQRAPSNDNSFWMPVIILGLISVTAVVIIAISSSGKKK